MHQRSSRCAVTSVRLRKVGWQQQKASALTVVWLLPVATQTEQTSKAYHQLCRLERTVLVGVGWGGVGENFLLCALFSTSYVAFFIAPIWEDSVCLSWGKLYCCQVKPLSLLLLGRLSYTSILLWSL